MNITLTPQLKEMVEQKVASGRYHSVSEVIREALRLFEERERDHDARLAALRAEVELGLKDLDEGRSSLMDENTLDELKAEGRKLLAEARKIA